MNFLPPDIALPFGLAPDGTLKPISEVLRGKACDCVCPGCHKPLIAKQGIILRHHFAHAADEACSTGFESMIHLLAKQLLDQHRTITIPAVSVTVGQTTKHVAGWRALKLTNIRLEQWLENMRPDIIGTFEGHDLIIEIAVTHKADDAKIEKLRQRDAPAVEIDLGGFHKQEVSEQTLWQAIHQTAPRQWLHNRLEVIARAEAAREEAERIRKAAELEANIAAEQARSVAEWARYEAEMFEGKEQQRKIQAQADEDKAAAIKRAQDIIYSGAIQHFKDAGKTTEWLDRMTKDYEQTGGFLSNKPNLGDFVQWCASHIRAEETRLARIEQARQTAEHAVILLAIKKYGTEEKARLWLTTTNPRIGNRRPADVLTDANAANLIRLALG